MMALSGWIGSLSDAQRESVFAAMRSIGERAMRYHAEYRRLTPRHGLTGIGSADFDPFLRATALDDFISSLRRGANPEAAVEAASLSARETIRRWNSVGCRGRAFVSNRVELHRADCSADTVILSALHEITRAASTATA